jgi:FkbM family methyltransferase
MRKFIHPFLVLGSTLYQLLREVMWGVLSPFKKKVSLYVFPEFKFLFLSKGYIVKEVYKQQHLVGLLKSWEYKTLKTIYDIISGRQVVVFDIGANVGLHSLFFSRIIGSGSIVHSFEPCTQTFNLLRSNIEINNLEKRIFPHLAGLSNYTGVGFINNSSGQALKGDVFNQVINKSISSDEEKVKVFKLDDWIDENQIIKIDLIKVDIEGGEFYFFEGAKECLKKFKPIIVFEVVESLLNDSDHGITDIFKYLFELDYSVTQIDGHNWLAIPEKNQEKVSFN